MPRIWRDVKRQVPNASLVITSDYRLWGASSGGTEQYRSSLASLGDVSYVGAVNRRELVKQQLRADFHIYPCTYDELFCISVAESLVAGAIPITTPQGALETTNMGVKISREKIVEHVVHLMKKPEKARKKREELLRLSRMRFNPVNISRQWFESVLK